MLFLLEACGEDSTRVSEVDGMVEVFVPGGSFQMGSTDDHWEQPVHTVVLTPYWIDQTEITASIEGPPLLIAFNVRFLRDVLEVIKTPNVALETTIETAPGVIRPVGEDNFLHVIMPMHLGS